MSDFSARQKRVTRGYIFQNHVYICSIWILKATSTTP